MPLLGYKQSEEHIRRKSEALLGNKNFLDHKHTEKTKRKIGCAHKGKIISKEIRAKMRELMKEWHKYNPHPKGMKGKKSTEKTKRILSEMHKGEKNSMYGIHLFGKKNSMYGKRHSKESKQKIGKVMSKRTGEFNPNWKGGISSENHLIRNSTQYKEWRRFVFERDDYTCQECNTRSGNGKTVYLHAHHIKSFADFPEFRFETDNGKTLCKDCHEQLRKQIQ